MAKLITPDGAQVEVAPRDPRKGFSLEEVYELLAYGCDFVQAVSLPNGNILLVDEEGKLRQPRGPKNPRATLALHGAGGAPSDFVVGNALIVTRKEFR